MSAILVFLKTILKVPGGDRFVASCIIAIGGLLIGGGFAVNGWIASNDTVIDLQKEKAEIRREHGTEMVLMDRRCDSMTDARVREARLEERDRWRETTAESRRQMDEALRNSDLIYNKQQRLIRTVKQRANK